MPKRNLLRISGFGALVVLLAVAGGIYSAKGTTHSQKPAREHASAPTTTEVNRTPKMRLVDFTGGDNGAIPLSDDPTAPACVSGSLTGTYWTTMPAMNIDLSGATITNTGTATCSLPTSVLSAEVVDATGAAVQSAAYTTPTSIPTASSGSSSATPTLPSPTTPAPEFENLPVSASTSSSGGIVDLPNANFQIEPLALEPSGKAVLIIETVEYSGSGTPSCIEPPAGGGILLSLGSESLTIPVPLMPAPADPADNVSGSAYYECLTGLLAPFVTWDEAVAVVGFGGIESPSGVQLPQKDNVIYDLAP
ncbi:MAG: hypothetical protein WAV54_02660 [Acidimicrobiales bacterium]